MYSAYLFSESERLRVEAPPHWRLAAALEAVIPDHMRTRRKGASCDVWTFPASCAPAVRFVVSQFVPVYDGTLDDEFYGRDLLPGWMDRWRAHRGERPTPALPVMDERASDMARLFLLPDAPEPLVKAAYRTLSKLYHADAGGDHDRMVSLNEAMQRLREGRAKG